MTLAYKTPFTHLIFYMHTVWIGIAVDVATIVLGILAMRNFDQGLKPYVQRGAKNKQKHHDLELNKTSTTDTWQIDD